MAVSLTPTLASIIPHNRRSSAPANSPLNLCQLVHPCPRENEDSGSTTTESSPCGSYSTRPYTGGKQQPKTDTKHEPRLGCQARDGCQNHGAAEMNLIESCTSSHVFFFVWNGQLEGSGANRLIWARQAPLELIPVVNQDVRHVGGRLQAR